MKTLLRLISAFLLMAGAASALAAIDLVGDDTDLFTTNPNIPSQVPSVLFVIDNTSNWSANNQGWPDLSTLNDPVCKASEGWNGAAQGDAELCAIYKAIANVDEQVNVGVMMTNDSDGGYIRFNMKQMNTTNKASLQALLKAINIAGVNTPIQKGPSNASFSNVMNDAFRYFNNFGVYATPTESLADASAYSDTGKTTFKYGGDTSNACGYAYIIWISNGKGTAENLSDLTAAAALLQDATVTPNLAVLQSTGINVDVWSRFLFQYGVKIKPGVYRHVTTYTLDVCKNQCNQTQALENATLLKSAAAVSQGKYFKTTDLAEIETALKTIFAEVQAVNSVFAATTLPVSINVRGTNLNQVYIGVFRPDVALSPRWLGNLKQYKLGINSVTNQLELVDSTGTGAVNLNTGFISNTATSIWSETTTPAGSGFWAFRNTYPATDVGKDQDAPDGDLVEKGGASQKIRQVYSSPDSTTAMTRNIYTCTSCTASDTNGSCAATACVAGATLKNYKFNVANGDITAQLLGTFAASSITSLVATNTTTARATVSGGHSFVVGNFVVISGATPTAYNSTNSPTGYWTITAIDTGNTPSQWFEYSIASGTISSFDLTHAYATFPGYTVTPGNDTVTVTSATPATYNVTNAAISAVVGNINQFSYNLGSSVSTAASGYSITANRKITSLVYSSATNRVTATVPNHGYATAGTATAALASTLTIAGSTVPGAIPGAFNTTPIPLIYNVTANTFEYTPTSIPSGGTVTTAVATPIPSGVTLTAGTSVVLVSVSGNSSYNTTQACTASATSNVGAVDGTASTFTYTVGTPAAPGTVTGTASGTMTVQNCVKADMDTYPITAAASASGNTLSITISAGTPLVSGQSVRALQQNDFIAVKGVTCTGRTCNTTSSTPTPSSTVFTFQITTVPTISGGNTTFRVSPGGSGSLGTISVASGASVYWTGPTTSPAATLTTVTAGVATVNATTAGTSSLVGDLTTKVTSLTSQGVATGTISAALNTSADTNERANLINWMRGQDNKDNENQNGVSTDIRASVHGDVLHSRPAVINYNRNSTATVTDDNDVFIFYGANDGLLHAMKGGSLATGGGKEQWAYAAPEFFSKYKRLRDQSPSISSSNPRNYFFDGPIAVYTLDADRNNKLETGTGDKVWMFVGMRRGGRVLYGFDLTDPTDPKLLWKKGCPNPTGTSGCDAGWEEIGQTWSQPQLAYLRNWSDKLVIIMAAGYDQPVEDLQPCFVSNWYDKTSGTAAVVAKTGAVVPTPMDATNCNTKLADTSLSSVTKTRSMGRGLFIIDAANGDILYRIGPDSSATKQVVDMEFSMPGDLAVLRNRDNAGGRTPDIGQESVAAGYMDRIYATDTGGNVWRIDVSAVSSDPAIAPPFVVSRLASLASTTYSSGQHPVQNYRKLMFSPDVVYTTETDGTKYDAVLVGSGDREHPFDMTVNNRFYMIKDKNISSLVTADVNTTDTDMKIRWAAPTVGVVTDTRPQLGVTTDASTAVDLYDVTNNCLQSASNCNTGSFASTGQTQTTAKNDLKAAKGWKLLYPNTGEKTVATATTAAGTVIFNTNQPKQDTVSGSDDSSGNFCTSDLGTARQYGINYLDATANNIFSSLPTQYVEAGGRDAMFAGGGFLPTPVPVVVQIDGKYYQTVIAGVQTTNPGGLKFQSRLRTYWYRKTE